MEPMDTETITVGIRVAENLEDASVTPPNVSVEGNVTATSIDADGSCALDSDDGDEGYPVERRERVHPPADEIFDDNDSKEGKEDPKLSVTASERHDRLKSQVHCSSVRASPSTFHISSPSACTISSDWLHVRLLTLHPCAQVTRFLSTV